MGIFFAKGKKYTERCKKVIDKRAKVEYNNMASLRNGDLQSIRRSTQVGRRGAPAKGVGRHKPAREFKSLLLRQKKAKPPNRVVLFFSLRRDLKSLRDAGGNVSKRRRGRETRGKRSGSRRRTRAKRFLQSVMRKRQQDGKAVSNLSAVEFETGASKAPPPTATVESDLPL